MNLKISVPWTRSANVAKPQELDELRQQGMHDLAEAIQKLHELLQKQEEDYAKERRRQQTQ